MRTQTATEPRAHAPVGDLLLSRWGLVTAFVLVHAWVVLSALARSGEIFGDVSLYHWWAQRGLSTGWWPVLHEAWVYPAAALVPVTLPALGTSGFVQYATVWSAMVIALNAGAVWLLARAERPGRVAALWWLGFLAALGPIWLGRLDGVAAPLILATLLLAHRNRAVATAVATLGAWIKIAPGALVVALAATSRSVRDLVRQVAVPGAVVSVVVVGLALAGGAGERAWSVFGEQSDRTLQAESVAATWFSVARLWDPSVRIEYNDVIYTYEVVGDAANTVGHLLDVALVIAVVVVGLLAWAATRRHPELAQDVLLLSAAATLFALVVFNKVGSPQFVAWLGPPVAAALALAGPRLRRVWLVPAVAMLGVGMLTQVLYPLAYGYFLDGTPWMVGVAAVRNVAIVVLLGGALWRLVQLAASQGSRPAGSPDVP
ncbi:hypothetical protein Xcel_0221 [Xylanimonas cellulosilytica DSM 15894]|uniref:DUF2029 domain-containing protein n=1 Tax=Xylanimonas cellulosilytica (strain DSM 15894 / JCM 12276 / CECT 5975 / KCTC 9989 / LMG 20990 / NBRC 107835 / XIL07) TaxID=446471 RepID=D1BUL9_XYLCX|nr:glycosyltransferase 87 family protein [Xylanimonas cellulosilytica]ACZ29260.1 hypothetical protein Xcel_0221 [Xylanimonas cellulosilytica DSM 15894]